MKTKILFFLLILICSSGITYSQIENVPLNNPVYEFLKEMRVKRIITDLSDDDPNLSRYQVADRLKTMYKKRSQLTPTEKNILNKYMIEFVPEEMNDKNTMSLFGGNIIHSDGAKDLLSDKQKYLYAYQKDGNNIFINLTGNLYYINQLFPGTKKNAKLFDGGFNFRGTAFDKLGYNFFFSKGGGVGDTILMEAAFPPIKSNFKYVENIENIKNYDFTNGYLKYMTHPSEGMDLSFQIGREQLKYGYGYSKSLTLSGDAPNLDFLKFNFKYGIVSFSSIFGSTVGEYHKDVTQNFTKYFTANKIKLSFKKILDAGIGEAIISSRGIELGYLNPIIFYKFVEHSLQDRDNGVLFIEAQTHFLKDFELQGTFFLDENILSNLSDFHKQSNKTAYQLGFFWYEPAGIRNLSLIFEYTKIRPYVYTHYNPRDIYTGFGVILGHPMGPNADQLFTKLVYNLSSRVNFNFEAEKIRKGENIYNTGGELVRNVGGSVYDVYNSLVDGSEAYFLDGVRVNEYNFRFNVSFEPLKNYFFDLNYVYSINDNLTYGGTNDLSYAYAKFTLGY